ncbi:hypothetical protein Naga_100264g8 [Nannochloropsis gaditana]|uniref:Uncharacterized protein n=1 Tax=Nannochloropsis gaditana TaxID=72520 RepID=W7U6A4_9STRA|nr:hypothetical protein Naga_100264g8 [Nannochloropsis gaditana]
MNLSEEMEGCSETRIELGEYKDGFENRQDHRVWEERALELPSTPSTREEDVGGGKHAAAEVEMEDAKGGREREDAVSARSIRSQRWQRHAVTTLEWTIEALKTSSSSSSYLSSSFAPSASSASIWQYTRRAIKYPFQCLAAKENERFGLKTEAKGIDLEGGGIRKDRSKRRLGTRTTLLQGIAGKTQSGEFTAVMGPSGKN